MSTNGELLSEPEFLALLAARKKEKKDELAKKAANQAARTDRAEQRIIDANETENLPCILIFRALRLYARLLLLRVVEARVLLRELRLVAIGFEQVADVAS